MVTLSKTPSLVCPNPVENDICFGLETTDFLQQAGTVAMLDIVFSYNSPLVVGQTFTILGQIFTVDAINSSTTVDLTSNDAQINANNLISALQSNIAFDEINIQSIGAGTVIITSLSIGFVDWAETLSSLGVTTQVINGSDAVFNEKYRLLYRLFCIDSNTKTPICPLSNPVKPPTTTDGEVLALCFNIKEDLSNQLQTTLPTLDQVIIFDETIKKDFILKYGSITYLAPCGHRFGDFVESEPFTVINMAIQPTDNLGIERYCFDELNDLVCFLSTRPEKTCAVPYDWAYICLNLLDFLEPFTQAVPLISFEYVAEIIYYLDGTAIQTEQTSIGTADGVPIIPVGSDNIIGTQPTDYDYYTLQIKTLADFGAGVNEIPFSKVQTFKGKGEGCKCDVTLIFLSASGGYTTLPCNYITALDVVTEGTEICKNVNCGGTFQENLTGGYQQVNTRSYERLTLETTAFQRTSELQRYYADFKASESRFIITKDDDGNDIIRRFMLDAGQTRIWQKDTKLKITLSGRYSQDRLTISES